MDGEHYNMRKPPSHLKERVYTDIQVEFTLYLNHLFSHKQQFTITIFNFLL